MDKKLIGAEPYYCVGSNQNVILEIFENEIITDDASNPIKIISFTECLSFGTIPECTSCPKHY